MNGKTLTLAAVAASLLIGTSAAGAFAQDRGGERGQGRGGPELRFVQMLQQFDTNKDGKITKDEATAASTALFVSIDTNKDGSLTPGELRAHREVMRAEMQAARAAAQADAGTPPAADAAKEQADAGPDMMPGEMAKGHDGKHHGDKDHAGKRHGQEQANLGEGGKGRDRGMGGPVRMIRVADTDENGQISQAEATTLVDKMFTRMDRNKDGVINADDMPKRPVMFR